MSTDFRTDPLIRMADLFDGRLKDFGVHERGMENAPTNVKCLTDGFSDLPISAAFDVDIEIIDLDIDMGVSDEPRAILRAPSRRKIESQAQR